MRRLYLLSTLIVGLALSGQVLGQSTAEEKQIKELIDKLGSDRFVVRERAKAALQKVGEPAVEYLRKACECNDLETARRARQILTRIEDQLRNRDLLKPSYVELKFENTPVEQAVAELARQSGYPIRLAGTISDRKITIDTGKVSFFEALDQLCAEAKLVEQNLQYGRNPGQRPVHPPGRVVPRVRQIQVPGQKIKIRIQNGRRKIQIVPQAPKAPVPPAVPPQQGRQNGALQAPGQPVPNQPPKAAQIQIQVNGKKIVLPVRGGMQVVRSSVARGYVQATSTITLTNGEPQDYPTSYAGAVRVRLLPASAARPQAGRPKPSAGAGEQLLVLEVTPEPRLKNFAIVGSPTVSEAVDAEGRSLSSMMDEDSVNDGVRRSRAVYGYRPTGVRQALVRLKVGDKRAESLEVLKGSLTAKTLVATKANIVVENVTKATGKTFKGKNDGSSLTIKSIRSSGKEVHITVEMSGGARNAAVPFGGAGRVIINGNVFSPSQMAAGVPTLVDKEGRKFEMVRVPTRRTQIINNKFSSTLMTLVFRPVNGATKPYRLELRGQENVTVEVPFTFKKVRLR